MNEEDAVDDQPGTPNEALDTAKTDAQRNADATEKEAATSFDFPNGDKGCDTNHHNCEHVAKHNSNKDNGHTNTNTGPVSGGVVDKLVKNLPNGCVIQSGPRVDLSRLIWEISCPK